MLDHPLAYLKQDYKDYTGPYFNRYKESIYFFEGGRKNPSYLKAEIAAYSEMTKIAILALMGMILYIYGTFTVIFVRTLLMPEFRVFSLLAVLSLIGLMLTWTVLGFIPRIVFLIKNFKAPKL